MSLGMRKHEFIFFNNVPLISNILISFRMNGQNRKDIYPGLPVAIVLKKDQRTRRLTEGIVKDILTSAPFHSRGIKVRLADGQIGRVHTILQMLAESENV